VPRTLGAPAGPDALSRKTDDSRRRREIHSKEGDPEMRMLMVLSLVAVTGCAVAGESRTGESLIGMSREQLQACAAWRAEEVASDGQVVLAWSARTADPGAGRMHPVAASRARYCSMSVTLRDGRVESVEYGPRSRLMMLSGDRCVYALDRC
jgi:hypothetical protein